MTAGFPSHSCFTDTYDYQLYSASFSCGCLTAYTASDIPKAVGYISSLIPRLISFLSSPSNFIITKLEHNSTTQNVPLRLPPRLQGRISTPRPPREAETAPTGPRRILGQHHLESSRESVQHLPALSVCQHPLSHQNRWRLFGPKRRSLVRGSSGGVQGEGAEDCKGVSEDE